MFIVAGTGSRSLQNEPMEVKLQVKEFVMDHLRMRWAEHLDFGAMSGMAEGFDAAIARSALDLGAHLWAVIPGRGYGPYYWGQHSVTGRNRLDVFDQMVEDAWHVTYVDDVLGVPGKLYHEGTHMNFHRNQYMVDHADEFLVWRRTSRGTKQCFGLIQAKGLPYIEVDKELGL